MEMPLLKALLSKSFFAVAEPYITEHQFSADGRKFYTTLRAAHEKYDAEAYTEEEIKSLYYSENTDTTAQRQMFVNLIEHLEDTKPPNKELAMDLLQRASDKQRMLEIAEIAIGTTNNGKAANFEGIQTIIEGSSRAVTSNYEEVTTDIDELLVLANPAGLMPLSRFPFLAGLIHGMGGGHTAIVHARTEIGKSSFAANLSVGFMEQGRKVSYFCNEEPGTDIMMNHVRAMSAMSDAQIQAEPHKARKKWNSIKDNLTLRDTVGMSLGELARYIEIDQPHVVILDQTDKIRTDSDTGKLQEDLKAVYCGVREIAKKYNVAIINVTQTSAEGEGVAKITSAMMENSKTGKQAEVDVIIGIGKSMDDEGLRHINVTKSKRCGRQGTVKAYFITETNQWVGVS